MTEANIRVLIVDDSSEDRFAFRRYLERYVGHLGTFRILTAVRVWCFRGIDPLAPAVLVDDRSGDVLTRIVEGHATMEDLHMLKAAAGQIEGHTICAFGEAAAWPVQGLIRHFRSEIEKRIDDYAANPHSEPALVAAE